MSGAGGRARERALEQDLARYRELAETRRAAIYEDSFSPATNRLARRLLERLPGTPTGLAIDLGCGPGTLLDDLRQLGWRALGVDLEEAMLRRARVRDAGAALVAADAAALPFANGIAD
jgi:predicted TPR repeat methyltransferase